MRKEWKEAWRTARILHNSQPANPEAFVDFPGLIWRAILRRMDRETPDPLTSCVEARLASKHIIDKILAERN